MALDDRSPLPDSRAPFQGVGTNDAVIRPNAVRAGGSRKTPSTSPRHGLTRLKAAVHGLGGRVVDRRTTLGKTLARWRNELIQDLGGADAVSTQERAIVDLAVRTKLLLDSVDAWLMTQPALVNKRTRALLPVVRERQQLADALSRYLQALGLERRARPVLSLDEYLKSKSTGGGIPAAALGGEPGVPAAIGPDPSPSSPDSLDDGAEETERGAGATA